MRVLHILSSFLVCLLLLSCTRQETESPIATPSSVYEGSLEVSGAKSAVFAAVLAGNTSISPDSGDTRPGATLGTYTSIYLTQNTSMGTRSALEGINVLLEIFESDASITEDETFALLQEYGAILQVDIVDTLNRSLDRATTLDQYLHGLTQMNELVAQKIAQLKTTLEDIGGVRSEQRKQVRAIEREINLALKAKDYSLAGPKQEELTEWKGKLAETESRESQTKQVLKMIEKLSKIGVERANAITKNREILIAGLQVIEVPGIEDLGILIGK